ncbi:hypothetical protein AN414_04205 [Serratia marcescens]|nr:hypothetical protein AN414_04205 [Serratia marcescens]
MQITVKAAHFLAAFKTMATKDVRYYLNGMFFDAKDKKLIATDDHRMFVGEHSGVQDSVIVSFKGKPPARFDFAEIDTDSGHALCYLKGDIVGLLPCNIVDGRYPDWRRLAEGFKAEKTDAIGFNADYVKDALTLAKLFNTHKACKFEFQGVTGATRITYNANAYLMLMPAQV